MVARFQINSKFESKTANTNRTIWLIIQIKFDSLELYSKIKIQKQHLKAFEKHFKRQFGVIERSRQIGCPAVDLFMAPTNLINKQTSQTSQNHHW